MLYPTLQWWGRYAASPSSRLLEKLRLWIPSARLGGKSSHLPWYLSWNVIKVHHRGEDEENWNGEVLEDTYFRESQIHSWRQTHLECNDMCINKCMWWVGLLRAHGGSIWHPIKRHRHKSIKPLSNSLTILWGDGRTQHKRVTLLTQLLNRHPWRFIALLLFTRVLMVLAWLRSPRKSNNLLSP